MGAVTLRGVVREGLTEKTQEQRPAGQGAISQKQERVPGRGDSKCKGPELGTHLLCLRNSTYKKECSSSLMDKETVLLSSRINGQNGTEYVNFRKLGRKQADNFSSFRYHNVLRTKSYIKCSYKSHRVVFSFWILFWSAFLSGSLLRREAQTFSGDNQQKCRCPVAEVSSAPTLIYSRLPVPIHTNGFSLQEPIAFFPHIMLVQFTYKWG